MQEDHMIQRNIARKYLYEQAELVLDSRTNRKTRSREALTNEGYTKPAHPSMSFPVAAVSGDDSRHDQVRNGHGNAATNG